MNRILKTDVLSRRVSIVLANLRLSGLTPSKDVVNRLDCETTSLVEYLAKKWKL